MDSDRPAIEIHGILGHGFLEKACQQAMQIELEKRGFKPKIEGKIRVLYKEADVGVRRADVLVNEAMTVELKVAKNYCPDDEPPLLNELKATGIRVGLLLNAGRQRIFR